MYWAEVSPDPIPTVTDNVRQLAGDGRHTSDAVYTIIYLDALCAGKDRAWVERCRIYDHRDLTVVLRACRLCNTAFDS
jgi:hypothetical protein